MERPICDVHYPPHRMSISTGGRPQYRRNCKQSGLTSITIVTISSERRRHGSRIGNLPKFGDTRVNIETATVWSGCCSCTSAGSSPQDRAGSTEVLGRTKHRFHMGKNPGELATGRAPALYPRGFLDRRSTVASPTNQIPGVRPLCRPVRRALDPSRQDRISSVMLQIREPLEIEDRHPMLF
jgi:hypothetical protein